MELRYLTKEDARFLYKLRSDPDVVKNSRHKPPTYQEHLAWVKKEKPEVIAMVIWHNDRRIGQLNLFKRSVGTCEVGISLMPEYRGKGIAAKALKIAHRLARSAGYSEVLAEVKKSNTASLALFEGQGYKRYYEGRTIKLIKEV